MHALVPALLLVTAAQAPAQPVLTFDEALAAAEERNLDLKAAQARLDQANELSRRAWAGYLPQLSVGGQYTYNSVEARLSLPTGYNIRDVGVPTSGPSDPSLPPSVDNPPGQPTNLTMVPAGFAEAVIQRHHTFGGQVQLQQALIAPQLWPAISNAYLAQSAARLNVENARREILFAAAQLYYGAAGLKESLAAQERMLEAQSQHVKDAKARYELGAGTRVALLRAQIEYARVEQNARRTRLSYESSISALATLLDRPPDFDVT
ncbi:MAG: TolC family protein, partial [Myxococcales bacterium]